MATSSEPTRPLDRQQSIERLAKDIKGIRIAMLTTADPDGVLRSRPMATQEAEFDGELWFFTKFDSGKVHSIEQDQHVNVAFADPNDNKYISVTGHADVIRDRALIKKYWTPVVKAFFPEGEEDPQLALIKVNIDSAEVWDSPSAKFVQLFGMAKAAVTGKPYEEEGSRHERMDLHH